MSKKVDQRIIAAMAIELLKYDYSYDLVKSCDNCETNYANYADEWREVEWNQFLFCPIDGTELTNSLDESSEEGGIELGAAYLAGKEVEAKLEKAAKRKK